MKKEILLTEKETETIRNLNAENGYGIDYEEALMLIKRHEKAREKQDRKGMALIQYRLTDINYHSLEGCLNSGLYFEAAAHIEETFKD